MTNNLHHFFNPITSCPYRSERKDRLSYIEIPPSKALAPYVYCFWGTIGNESEDALDETFVDQITPDGCMDIILDIDYEKQKTNNIFCGISNRTFSVTSKPSSTKLAVFAIRFYPWAVVLFSDDNLKNVKNCIDSTEIYFQNFKSILLEKLIHCKTIEERIKHTETYLLKKINLNRTNHNIMNAVHKTMKSKGSLSVKALSDHVTLSNRQLERLFKLHLGLTPKEFTNVIRYQYLWQEIAYSRTFDIQDAVHKYGYSDQSHLINNFKLHHGMTPSQAKIYADEHR